MSEAPYNLTPFQSMFWGAVCLACSDWQALKRIGAITEDGRIIGSAFTSCGRLKCWDRPGDTVFDPPRTRRAVEQLRFEIMSDGFDLLHDLAGATDSNGKPITADYTRRLLGLKR